MSAEDFPDFGGHDRAHFDFEAFVVHEKQLEEDVAEMRAITGSEPYIPPPKPEKLSEPEPSRADKVDSAAKFLASLDDLLLIAS